MTTKPHWETCAEIVDRLATGAVATKKDIQDLRGAVYQMQLWFETIQELREGLKNHDSKRIL